MNKNRNHIVFYKHTMYTFQSLINFSAAFGKMTTLLLKHGLSLASGISPGFSWVLLGFPLIISLLVSPYPLGPFWWIPVVLVF